MGFWDKSLRIFKCLCDNATQSARQLAQQTGLSKSRVYRLQQAMERCNSHPESWFWETEEGRQWLRRLVVATLPIFGLKRGVGLDTMSEFFARLHLEAQAGCSPVALRSVMQALEAALLETAEAWEKDGCTRDEGREIIGAVDETFLARKCIFNAGLIPNIPENPRNRKRTRRGRKRFFNEAIHALRMRVERTFAWEDKFKRLLMRFEHIQQRHYGMKLMAYTLINLRVFYGT